MKRHVIFEHPTHTANGYFWFIQRAFESLSASGEIELTYVAPLHTESRDASVHNYVRQVWVDEVPFIVDLRDSHHLPLVHMGEEPSAHVLKSHVPLDFWAGVPKVEWSEYRGMLNPQAERSIVLATERVTPFFFGRAISGPIDMHVRRHLEVETLPPGDRPFEVSCLLGAGQTWQQTHNRLRLLELLRDVFGARAQLLFFRGERCVESEQVHDFEERSAAFAPTPAQSHEIQSLRGYYRWLSRAKVSINVPGFCLSQPFRLVDGILARTPTVSTRIWSWGYEDFPCVGLPLCAFTGIGAWDWRPDEELTDQLLEQLVAEQEQWYERRLTPRGILGQFEEWL